MSTPPPPSVSWRSHRHPRPVWHCAKNDQERQCCSQLRRIPCRLAEVVGVKEFPMKSAVVGTHCPYCGLQCAMSVSKESVSPLAFPTNQGRLCQKGWTAAELLSHPERLTRPLVRRDGVLCETSWDEALDYVAHGFRRGQILGGKDAVGIFGAGALTNEKAYLLGKFARVAVGTANIDYSGRFCMSAAAEAGLRCFGLDRGLPFPVTDLSM